MAAFEAMKFAAEHGELLAMFNLAHMYKEGRGCSPNLAEALRWLEAGVAAGDEACNVNLAAMYAFGQMVAIDEDKALEFIRAPVRNGNSQALRLLAEIERRRKVTGRRRRGATTPRRNAHPDRAPIGRTMWQCGWTLRDAIASRP